MIETAQRGLGQMSPNGSSPVAGVHDRILVGTFVGFGWRAKRMGSTKLGGTATKMSHCLRKPPLERRSWSSGQEGSEMSFCCDVDGKQRTSSDDLLLRTKFSRDVDNVNLKGESRLTVR